jgi:hypothetical protein
MTRLPELDSLPREMPPPPGLESRIAIALRAQGLLKSPTRLSWISTAAAILMLVLGIGIGRWWPRPARFDAPPVSTSRFLFLLSDADTSGDDGARAEAYRRWAVTQRQSGRQISGERLGDSGFAVMNESVAAVARADVQGYFVVSAATMDDAIAVARSSPHVQSGGTIIVRPINTP